MRLIDWRHPSPIAFRIAFPAQVPDACAVEALLAYLSTPCHACGMTGAHSPWCALRAEREA